MKKIDAEDHGDLERDDGPVEVALIQRGHKAADKRREEAHQHGREGDGKHTKAKHGNGKLTKPHKRIQILEQQPKNINRVLVSK